MSPRGPSVLTGLREWLEAFHPALLINNGLGQEERWPRVAPCPRELVTLFLPGAPKLNLMCPSDIVRLCEVLPAPPYWPVQSCRAGGVREKQVQRGTGLRASPCRDDHHAFHFQPKGSLCQLHGRSHQVRPEDTEPLPSPPASLHRLEIPLLGSEQSPAKPR